MFKSGLFKKLKGSSSPSNATTTTTSVDIPNQTPEKSSNWTSTAPSITVSNVGTFRQRRYKSAKLEGEFERPWLQDSEHRYRETLDRILFYIAILIGVGVGAGLCFKSYMAVPKHDYCLVMDDNFQTLDRDLWDYEVELGGYGSGSFDWTTQDPRNAYVSQSGLHIVPTLTLETTNISIAQFTDGYTLNLTSTSCTAVQLEGDVWEDLNNTCTSTSNATLGTIINPVRSARLSTKGKKSIRYGRVEVVAKLPKGDWLWPAIWMLPEENVYGTWPASGEIDLCESRGNDRKYFSGRDKASSTLHWGPNTNDDAWARSTGTKPLKRGDYSDGFHTFGLEWSEDYIFTWVDNRNNKVIEVPFGSKLGTLWDRGGFGDTIVDGSVPVDPWSQTGNFNTPFDQSFHLILNVAVGATNGYFRDGAGGKPWVDGTATAARDFWRTNSTWSPTWGQGDEAGMTVRSVKMWQQGKCSA